MRYIKHLILTVLAMVMLENAWGTDIYIYVHYANGTWPANIAASNFTNGNLKVACHDDDQISAVKANIATLTGLVVSEMQLGFGNNDNLSDDQTLNYYNIQNESTVTLINPTQPQRYGENRDLWRVQAMPHGNRVLRATWKEEVGLAWKLGDEDVPEAGVSGYLGFENAVTFPTLDTLDDYPFHLYGHYGSSNPSVATINDTGKVSFVGIGTTFIYAVYNDDEYYDSVYYKLTVGDPYTLTLGVNNSDWGSVAPILIATINLNNLEQNITVQDGDVLTGTLSEEVQISIADGATVILNGVS